MKLQAAAVAPINKTMLGETEPPIRYNCPRCKKPLESPAIEAGTKKPCPSCGGRLQVPAAPPRASIPPNLNKTILASDETAPGTTAVKAGQPSSAPAAATTVPSSHAANSVEHKSAVSKRGLMIGGIAAAGVLFLLLLTCVVGMAFSGGGRDKIEKAQKDFAQAQKELEELKKEKQTLLAQQMQFEAERKSQWDKLMEKQEARQRELDLQRQLDRDNLLYQNDKAKAAEAAEKRRREQEQIDRDAKDRREKVEQDAKAKLDALQAQLNAANQRAQQATVIVSQPPPVYYPPYHPRYYWGW